MFHASCSKVIQLSSRALIEGLRGTPGCSGGRLIGSRVAPYGALPLLTKSPTMMQIGSRIHGETGESSIAVVD